MSRAYTLKKRAEQQAKTRRRIVEAAVELHTALGPARTPLSLVAERAGVQRKTLYAHFGDERALMLACSGLALERDPPPDPVAWRTIEDRPLRLRTGLASLYAWYRRNSDLFASVLRDADYHPLTREIAELRFGPTLEACKAVLLEGLVATQVAMLTLALDFSSWRILTRGGGLDDASAAEAMAEAITRA